MRRLLVELSSVSKELGNRPLALFGHSLGGLVAFEFARQLRRIGHTGPCRLFVSATNPPHLPLPAKIAHLRRDDFLKEVVRRYGGIPQAILEDPEMLEYFLPILKADLTLLESYVYEEEEPLRCPIHAFSGASDVAAPMTNLDQWGIHTTQTLARKIFSGGHFFTTTAREELLRTLVEALHEKQ